MLCILSDFVPRIQDITLDLILTTFIDTRFASLFHFLYTFAQLLLCIVVKLITSYRFRITLLLLISFSATQFPFELFHNHNATIVCSDYGQGTDICQHKSHLATKKDHCLACSIHVEKVFLFTSPLPENNNRNSFLICHFSSVTVHSNKPDHTTLRGPPHFIA